MCLIFYFSCHLVSCIICYFFVSLLVCLYNYSFFFLCFCGIPWFSEVGIIMGDFFCFLYNTKSIMSVKQQRSSKLKILLINILYFDLFSILLILIIREMYWLRKGRPSTSCVPHLGKALRRPIDLMMNETGFFCFVVSVTADFTTPSNSESILC